MCYNDRDTRMHCLVIGLRHHGKVLTVSKNPVHMLLQCIEGVCIVLCVVLLFRPLIIGLACHGELLGCSRVVLLQNAVKEDIPDLCTYHTVEVL